VSEKRRAYKVLRGNPERKRSLGRPRRKWQEDSKWNLIEIGWEGVDWVHLAQDRDH
jgi:hypothetical protein